MRFSLVLFLLAALPARAVLAQQPGGAHTAPGKPLRVQRGIPPAYVPVKPAKAPEILPRYWQAPDSAAQAAQYQKFWRALRLSYPPMALRESVGWQFPSGRFTFRLIIGADGVPQAPVLVRRALTLAESAYNPSTVQALEDEANRVLSGLRFEPSAKVDTLTVPIYFPPLK